MQQSELLKRLSSRQKIEVSLRTDEKMTLKMINKYTFYVNKLEAAIKDLLSKREINRRRLRALKVENEMLKTTLQQEETKIRAHQHMQAEFENLISHQENELIKKCIKKESDNIFLNTKALPGAVQGMSVCQNQWLPFNFPINSLNMSGVPLEFWSHTQSHSNYREQCDELILGSIH